MIPVRLRDQAGMVTGREYDFEYYVKDGHKFIAIDCGPVEDSITLEEAMEILRKHGYKFVQDDNWQQASSMVE